MRTTLENGKVLLHRTAEDRQPLLKRLSRIEGQIRGIAAMIEDDRYCGDELQQIKAVMAALRGVAMIIAEQHLLAAAELAGKGHKEPITSDIKSVLERVLGL